MKQTILQWFKDLCTRFQKRTLKALAEQTPLELLPGARWRGNTQKTRRPAYTYTDRTTTAGMGSDSRGAVYYRMANGQIERQLKTA